MNPSAVCSTPGTTSRILIVDDEEESRRLMFDMLRHKPYRLYLAENGRDGFEKARYIVPDLILMDVRMPVCDGIAACRLLKAEPRTASIPLIFLTGAASVEERVQGLSEGAVDYIAKPFNAEEVRLRMAVHLGVSHRTLPLPVADPGMAKAHGASDEAAFGAARALLLQDLARTPSLVEMARAVGMHSRRLNEVFRKHAGSTVFEYLFEARMKEARRLLAETGLEIKVIAHDVGYGCPANFSTAFKERFGLTPRQYRKAPQPDSPD